MKTFSINELESRFEQARLKFKNFLEKNNNRKTPERFAILKEIYMNQHHFDAEALYIKMKQNAYRVSRATIYNTLDILVECDLIQRHQFGHNKTLYERAHGFEPHNHIICTNCGKIMEFIDTRIDDIVKEHSLMSHVNMESHSMNIYGLCDKCNET